MFGRRIIESVLTMMGLVTFPIRATVEEIEFERKLHFDLKSLQLQGKNYSGTTLPQCVRNCKEDRQCLSLLQDMKTGTCNILYGFLNQTERVGPFHNIYFEILPDKLCTHTGFSYSAKYGICYLYPDLSSTHDGAHRYCEERDSSLIRVDTTMKQTFLQDTATGVVLVDGYQHNSPYNHGSDKTWRYRDGTEMTTFFWVDGYPKSTSEHACIVAYHPEYRWTDSACNSRSYRFICEWLKQRP